MSEASNQEKTNIPVHVAIIADGNRRWAKEHNLPTLEGHRRGLENAEKLIYKARELGVKCLTGWMFSTENWKRSQEETGYLFSLATEFAKRFRQKFIDAKVRFRHIGRKDRIPADVAKILADMEEETKEYTDYTVCIAMDYGGRDEITRAIKKLTDQNLEVTAENIEKNLDTAGLPDPDLIIRTGGAQRLSGFMPWQSEYAEFLFPETYFPDFGPEQLEQAVKDFTNRDRRFGGNSIK